MVYTLCYTNVMLGNDRDRNSFCPIDSHLRRKWSGEWHLVRTVVGFRTVLLGGTWPTRQAVGRHTERATVKK